MSVSANFAGDYEPEQASQTIQSLKTGSAIAKGDVCNLSSGSWQTAATGGSGPFAVCIKAAAASDTTVSLLINGIVYVTADGAITPNSLVLVSASTAGQVQGTATAAINTSVGMYLGHENQGDGSTVPTAAADGDVIRIALGKVN